MLHRFSIPIATTAIRLVLCLLGGAPGVVWAGLLPYTTIPIAVPSTAYTLEVNGQPVYVEKLGDVSYARFAFLGTANLVVTATATITSRTISPISYGIPSVINGNTLSFSLKQPRTLILRINAFEKLLIFADGPEIDPPKPGDPGVVNLGTYFAPGRDQNATVTATVQSAIDAVAALNGGAGGILYVPDGLYMCAQLQLKSNVRLHLSSGAVIRAITNFSTANYPRQQTTDSSFIYVSNADNVKITGRGVIDGNGWNLRHANPSSGNCKLYRSRNSTNLTLEDVYLRDSARWTVQFLYSDHITVRRVKMINDIRLDGDTIPYVTNTDGYDIDASTDVLVDRCFIYTGDDALTPKVTTYMGLRKASRQHTLVNNVIWTLKCALKVGSELDHDMNDIYLANNEVVYADRFLALWADYGIPIGYTISDITAVNNRTETIGHLSNRCFFYFQVITYTLAEDPTPTPANIARVLVNGLYAAAPAPTPYNSLIKAYDSTHLVQDVTIKNMYIAGAPVTSFTGIPLKFPAAPDTFYRNIGLVAPGGSSMEVRSGVPTVSTTIVPVTPDLPLVEVFASDDWGREGADTVTFTLSRVGSLAAPLTVNYSMGGTATNGADYTLLPSSITFPAGIQQVQVTVTPLEDSIDEGSETVTLTIDSAAAYSIGVSGAATATISNALPNELSLPTVILPSDALVTFRKPVTTYGATYEVETSSDLNTWSTAGITLQLLSTVNGVETWQASRTMGTKIFFRLKVTTPP